MLKRYKNNVGKEIGGYIYFHRKYIRDFKDIFGWENYSHISQSYNIIKLAKYHSTITFLKVPDFDTSHEPRVVAFLHYKNHVWNTHEYKTNPPVYHHKWLFVKDDYQGFDIEEAKRRSEWVASLPIKKNNIGYYRQWQKILETFGNVKN